jgi:hypothetical protein
MRRNIGDEGQRFRLQKSECVCQTAVRIRRPKNYSPAPIESAKITVQPATVRHPNP